MQLITRFTLSLLIALATCFGAFALVGCGGSSSSAAENASSAASDAADDSDEEQDNCYGDDLPAKRQ